MVTYEHKHLLTTSDIRFGPRMAVFQVLVESLNTKAIVLNKVSTVS